MKCFSRSTLGVGIGAINICCFAVLIIYIIALIFHASSLSEEEIPINTEILTTSITLLYIILIISIVSLITSVLLVLGIIKQRHTLMQPWIYSAVIGIAFYIMRIIISVVAGLTAGLSFGSIVATLFVGLLMLGLQVLIFYPIYTLYTDFRDATSAQEQQGLNNFPQSPPSYAELEKGGEMYN